MWAVSKRIFLFLAVNILVFTTLNISFSLAVHYLGIEQEIYGQYQGLLIWAVFLGMSGAIISLFLSKTMAKMAYKVKIIDPKTSNPELKKLVSRVHEYARMAGIKKMPEVGIYESPEVNAFATGPSKNNSLVAVSSGILQAMDSDELEGVLGHEIAHIANGDMVTMTLVQGVINTLVIFVARIIANIISSNMERRSFMVDFAIYMGLQMILSILGSIVVNYFSRWREFRADEGSARIAGREKMIKSLQRLQNTKDLIDTSHEGIASLKISDKPSRVLSFLFSTHPPLEARIQRLQGRRI